MILCATDFSERAGDAVSVAAERGGADLIVVGRHGHGAISPLIGSVGGGVLRASRRPVVIVRDQTLGTRP